MALTNAQHQKLWRDRRRKEKDMRAEAEAEAVIEQLHGTEQRIAIQRLVSIGAGRFVAEVARRQRTERLRELRASRGAPEPPRDRGPIYARIRAIRLAKGLDVD